jgi:hypothetical protein
MMRYKAVRAGVFAAVFLIGAPVALGASLDALGEYPGEDGTQGRAITPDGKYIVGNSYNSTFSTPVRGLLWETANPAVAHNLINGGRQAVYGTGIGYRTVAAGKELVALGKTTSGPTTYAFDLFMGATPVQKWSARDANLYANANLPSANSLGGTDGEYWYVTFDEATAGVNQNLHTARGEGDPVGTMTNLYAQKSTPNESHVRGVSGTGIAVGGRRDTSGGPIQNYYWPYAMPTMGQIKFKGLKAGSSDGEAWAISLDGTKIGGYAPVDDGRTGNWPYLYDVATDTIVELPTLMQVPGFATNGIVYGLSPDGRYAVGMDFTRGLERAVLWDTQLMTILDLTDWATSAGILGPFTGNLRRGYSVGVNDLGQPVVTGYGYASDLSTDAFTGYVLTLDPGVATGACCVSGFGTRSCSLTFEDDCPEPGVWTENASCAAACPLCNTPFADVDYDGDVDQEDYGFFQACFTGPIAPANPISAACGCLNRTGSDGDVDEDDYVQFQNCAMGPEVPFDVNNPPAGCTP